MGSTFIEIVDNEKHYAQPAAMLFDADQTYRFRRRYQKRGGDGDIQVKHAQKPGILLAMAMAVSSGAAYAGETKEARLIADGRMIAEQNCAACHAIGNKDQSPNAASPPFRTLASKYPLESLVEALAEGISVGHAEMPQFQFEPKQIDALVAYLESVQPRDSK